MRALNYTLTFGFPTKSLTLSKYPPQHTHLNHLRMRTIIHFAHPPYTLRGKRILELLPHSHSYSWHIHNWKRRNKTEMKILKKCTRTNAPNQYLHETCVCAYVQTRLCVFIVTLCVCVCVCVCVCAICVFCRQSQQYSL